MTNLKRIIDEKGIRQRWLAEQVGVTEVSMSRYVNGERIPKAPIAIRMADVLGVDVKDLYGWDDAHVIGENEAQPETHEERTETHACDLISRQAAIDALTRFITPHDNGDGTMTVGVLSKSSITDILNDLPSAQPELIEREAYIRGFEQGKTQGRLDTLSAQPKTHEKRTETHACDLTNSQQAINLLKGLEQSLDDYCELNDEGKAAFRMAITALELFGNSEQLPSAQPDMSEYSDKLWKAAYERGKAEAQQRWIPCSERLPEEGQEILATTTDNAWGDVVIIRTYYKEMHKSVIAWMPLPEPYAERRTDG